MKYEILRLSAHPDWAGRMADWFSSKWAVPREAYAQSMAECLQGAPVPEWYVAVADGQIIGGLGVIDNDFHPRRELTPNVCAVFTEPEFRCRGIAGALLERAAADQAALGNRTLYLLTDHTAFYERYGWRYLCPVTGDGETEPSRMYVHEAGTDADRAEALRRRYGLSAHEENGAYLELNEPWTAPGRAPSGAIYYHLGAQEYSEFHVIDCDEYWCHIAGAPLELWLLREGKLEVKHLGTEPDCDPLLLVPAGTIFAARHRNAAEGTFLSCITVPRFTYEAFTLLSREEMLSRWPETAAFYEKSREELENLKKEVEALRGKLRELSAEELEQVAAGTAPELPATTLGGGGWSNLVPNPDLNGKHAGKYDVYWYVDGGENF